MTRRGIAGIAAVASAVAFAPTAAAATGTLTVQVDTPRSAPVPASVLAYPLDPAGLTVGAPMPGGRATLRLEAGPWLVATAVPTASGRQRVAARLVVVAPGRRTPLGTTGAASASVSVGTIRVPAAALGGSYAGFTRLTPQVAAQLAGAMATSLATARLAELVKKGPCAQRIVPGDLGRSPLWSAIVRAAVRAARSGPSGARAAARAAAEGLREARATTGTFGGTVTRAGAAAAGTFRVTDPSGRVVFERSYARQNGVNGLLERALKDALRDVCSERQRIQVDVTFSFDVRDDEARGVGIVALSAAAIEQVAPNGRVEQGAYEHEAPASWTTRDIAVQGLRCEVTLGGVDVGPPEAAPTQLAVESNGRYSVQLAPAIVLVYDYVSPCSGSGSLPLSMPIQPALVLEVPGLDQEATRTGEAAFGGASGTYAASVTVRRLPSDP